jgi:hypothetical protein
MLMTKRVVFRLAILGCVAIAVPAAGQTGPGGSGPDKRLSAWQNQLVLPQKVSARLSWAQRRLKPSGLDKLKKMGRTLAPAIAAGDDFDPLRGQAEQDVTRTYPGLAATDVSETAFFVLAMATEDMDDDIRQVMAEIRAMNAAKQKLRGSIKELNGWISEEMSKPAGTGNPEHEKVERPGTPPPLPRRMAFETRTSPVIHLEYAKASAVPPLPSRRPGLTAAALRALLSDAQKDLDVLNEMSEMNSLRLQMTMDRRAKFIQTLSNLIKKLGSAQERLVQNIK